LYYNANERRVQVFHGTIFQIAGWNCQACSL